MLNQARQLSMLQLETEPASTHATDVKSVRHLLQKAFVKKNKLNKTKLLTLTSFHGVQLGLIEA